MNQLLHHATVPGASSVESSKYILFGLDGDQYAISLLQLQEIIADFEVTSMPHLPVLYDGVVSVRGEAIPLMNLRRSFGRSEVCGVRSRRSRVLIVDLDENAVGVLVDEVYRVVTIEPERIEEPPEVNGMPCRSIAGVAELQDKRFTIILDMQQVLSEADTEILAEVSQVIQEELETRSETLVSDALGLDDALALHDEDDTWEAEAPTDQSTPDDET